MSDEESGGVKALRAWAGDAAERVKRLVPAMGADVLPPRAYEASIAELDQLARLLDHDPGLRSTVSVWLAGALSLWNVAGGGTPADRERAERLLRDVRDPGTALGATATAEERRWAALFLLSFVSPVQSQRGDFGAAPDFSALVEWISQAGPAGMLKATAEIQVLTAEVAQLPLPREFLEEMRRMQGLFTTPPGPEYTDLLMSAMPAGDPGAEQLRRMLDQLFGMAGAAGGGQAQASGPRRTPAPGSSAASGSSAAHGASSAPGSSAVPDASSDPEPSPVSGPLPETGPPPEPQQTFAFDDLRRVAAAMDATSAAAHGVDRLLDSDDPAQALNDLLRRLRAVQDAPPPGPDPTAALETMRAFLLNIGHAAGGSHQDREAGRAHMTSILGYFDELSAAPPPGLGNPAVMGRAFALYSRVMDAGEAEDVQTLRELVDEAEALEKAAPEGHPFRYAVLLALGAAYARLGAANQDKEMLQRAVSFFENGFSGLKESGLPFADQISLPHLPDFDLLRAALTEDRTAVLPDHVPPPPTASTEELHRSALSLRARYALTRDRADLDTLIDELERVCAGVRKGRAPRIAADALWELAEAYRERGVRNNDVQDVAALEAAREALSTLGADVLLQAGAEHGLLAARAGASRGVRAALWAASQGRLHGAVAALELGRAMVLQAASTSSDVPELLDAAGRHKLAESWRKADAPLDGGPAGQDGVPGEMLSTLRREALEALGYRQSGGLLGTLTMSDLADGVAQSGADALVYLVPGDDADAGVMIAVAPRLGVKLWVTPLLSGAESGPLEGYLDATAVRDAAVQDGRLDPSAEQAWEESLAALCDWAYQVLGPALAEVRERLAAEGDPNDRPLRCVLVPSGRLGIVPWHAARRTGDGVPHDYLCRTAVISYAASGSQFLRTVRRAPRDPAAAPVLLADPNMSLTHAEIEVMALRDAFYRNARMCGGLFEVPDEELAPGTPDDVLAFLADGASVLHVASHGSAGTRPTVSALHLAAPEHTGDPAAAEVGTGPAPGQLTVTRLLDRPDGQRAAEEGPLVVLSACQTDLSTRDHDEALTLTTAFVAGGARDVVGSRWTTQDSASALLMAVFHHRLAVDGLSPVDALRAAQLWMLDPCRENPGSLRGELLRQLDRPDLDRIALWAAFIHQGHPGPGRPKKDTGRGNA